MFKVIIAGSRGFNRFQLLCDRLDFLLSNKNKDEIEIVCGCAAGADRLGEKYAKLRGYKISYFPVDWDSYGNSAGYRRNKQMAEYADACVCFWDGFSRGTKHMIDLAKQYKLKLKVIKWVSY